MLETSLQQFIHISRYARWQDELGRRETWPETVDRYCEYFHDKYPKLFPKNLIFDAIHNINVMPSMRALMTAGEALDRDNMAGYNCAYRAVDDLSAFDEVLHTLMCGTGVGFSVEKRYVNKLPGLPESFKPATDPIAVEDSKEGWATALNRAIAQLWGGVIPRFNVDAVRPAGARLKTFGGRASGPDPLLKTLDFLIVTCINAKGRKLKPIECHDIMCIIASNVVVGGVRRSALISLSDIDDTEMRNCKSGAWWEKHPHRALANNSAVYNQTPGPDVFWDEWTALRNSHSGERGIFNRCGAEEKIHRLPFRQADSEYGTNPCGEIILRSKQLCNLSEVVIRPNDTLLSLAAKVKVATIIGTFQSTLINFGYASPDWRKNCAEERLLGVSLTGIMDHPVLSKPTSETAQWLKTLKYVARGANQDYANRLGIHQSSAITTVKPSGTVSQLVDSASGIHPRYSNYYVRTIRGDKKDPLSQFMRDIGVPVESCVLNPDNTDVFSFPVESPKDCVTRDEKSAIEQLRHYSLFNREWCEHSPSITVYVKEHEWEEVGAYVHDRFDRFNGITFLPHDNHSYQQAPYQEIDEVTYRRLKKQMPNIDWTLFSESDDNTVNTKELACRSGSCEI